MGFRISTLKSAIRNLKTKVVPPAGLEPATPGLGIRCSIRLSYGGMQIYGKDFSNCARDCARNAFKIFRLPLSCQSQVCIIHNFIAVKHRPSLVT